MAQPNSTTPSVHPVIADLTEKNIVTKVGQQIQNHLERGLLQLPEDYSVANAIKSAYLELQNVLDSSKKPALQVCTQASVINAIMNMAIQGLNPAKKQCYFIVYGNQLTCQRSYFGDIAIVQRILPGSEVYFEVVYEGDEFQYEIRLGKKHIAVHKQDPKNINDKKIEGAYCGIINSDGIDLGMVYMPFAKIQGSWAMSKSRNDSSPHAKFASEMALRTVIRKRCKTIINSSNDEMLQLAIKESEQDQAEAAIDMEISENGNGEVLAITAEAESQTGLAVVSETQAVHQPELVTAVADEKEQPPY